MSDSRLVFREQLCTSNNWTRWTTCGMRTGMCQEYITRDQLRYEREREHDQDRVQWKRRRGGKKEVKRTSRRMRKWWTGVEVEEWKRRRRRRRGKNQRQRLVKLTGLQVNVQASCLSQLRTGDEKRQAKTTEAHADHVRPHSRWPWLKLFIDKH